MSRRVIVNYVPDGPVLREFFQCRAPVSIIQGPVGCLSAETEYLTRDGWCRMDAYDGGEVMVWKDGRAWFEEPEAYVDKPCDAMWHFHNEHSLSMVVSDEHRMPMYDRNGKFRVRLAADVARAPGRYSLPVSFRAVGSEINEAKVRLIVAISADGCFPKRGNQVVVTVRKDRKKERMRELLSAAGVSWQELPHSTRPTELTFAMPRLPWMTKTLDFWSCGQETLSAIVDEVQYWDGLHESADCRYSTTDRGNADFIQFAAHATGRRATISSYDDPRKESWSTIFTVHITNEGSAKASVGMRGDNVKIDRVRAERKYCFTVSSGFFIARHNGRVFVTGNSGTSTACCHKMWKISLEQRPDENGYRKSRWLIVRNTFDQLKQTTLKTWKLWFEEKARGAMGVVKMSNPPEHNIKWPLPDGTTVMAEFIFLSLDSDEDVGKLLSMEYTGAWFNEAQFSEKVVFDMAHSRAMQGRYPPLMDGGPSWKGVICDLNAPPEGHWIPYMRGDVPLPLDWDEDKRKEYENIEGWKFYTQPAGLIEIFENGRLTGYRENPNAENQKWLQESYLELIKGKSKSYVDTYVMNRVGLHRSGKPVFESFVPETHVAKERLRYVPEWPVIVGLDFARNPAAVICQLIRGQMYVLDEFGMENVSAGTFAPLLKQRLAKNFPGVFSKDGAGIQFWGDPTGGSRGQATDQTPFQIFRANGMNAVAAPGNNVISIRLEAVETLLSKMVDGGPALILDPQLRTLKAGMAGAYHFAKVQGQSGRFHDVPYKDRYSDFCDALQYACLGAGLGFEALNPGKGKPKPQRMKRKRYSLKRA